MPTGGSLFDEAIVGNGGAGYLWDLNLSKNDAKRTSLIQPSQWDDAISETSDEASVATAEDIASDLNEPPEGAAEASPTRFLHVLLYWSCNHVGK